jgi:hypothetical protein
MRASLEDVVAGLVSEFDKSRAAAERDGGIVAVSSLDASFEGVVESRRNGLAIMKLKPAGRFHRPWLDQLRISIRGDGDIVDVTLNRRFLKRFHVSERD